MLKKSNFKIHSKTRLLKVIVFLSIAKAASGFSKTYRDEYMDKIHEEFPMYNWKKKARLPTKTTEKLLRNMVHYKYHPMSFRLLPDQLSFDFKHRDYFISSYSLGSQGYLIFDCAE